jgi:hypothetical protein
MMYIRVKDEKTENERYFIYVTRGGWTMFTGLRFDSNTKAEKVADAIRKAIA